MFNAHRQIERARERVCEFTDASDFFSSFFSIHFVPACKFGMHKKFENEEKNWHKIVEKRGNRRESQKLSLIARLLLLFMDILCIILWNIIFFIYHIENDSAVYFQTLKVRYDEVICCSRCCSRCCLSSQLCVCFEYKLILGPFVRPHLNWAIEFS